MYQLFKCQSFLEMKFPNEKESEDEELDIRGVHICMSLEHIRKQLKSAKHDIGDCKVETNIAESGGDDDINTYEWDGLGWGGPFYQKIYYPALKVMGKGESVRIKRGDHVIIENADDRERPFVAKVKRFYEDTKKKEKRMLVEW